MRPGDDLWGRKPRRPVTCPGCGQSAEPYHGRFCWLCVHAIRPGLGATQFALVMRTTAYQDRVRVSGLADPPAGG